MPDMMVIVSKAVFEKESPKAKLGEVQPLKVYRSASKHLERLDDKSRLFLVTVRPPKEALWLVAVLENLKFDGAQWTADQNRFPLADISGLKGQLKFESGKGIQANPGALGMSLQTPRVLTADDAALLMGSANAAAAAPPKPVRTGPINLTAHQDHSPLPCLCNKCLALAPPTMEAKGATFFRSQVEVSEKLKYPRVLHFWVPKELEGELESIALSVKGRLQQRLAKQQRA